MPTDRTSIRFGLTQMTAATVTQEYTERHGADERVLNMAAARLADMFDPEHRAVKQKMQEEIEELMDRMRSRTNEIEPLLLKQVERDAADPAAVERLRERFFQLVRRDDQLTDLSVQLAVVSAIAERDDLVFRE
jgi:hypothetical protein